MTSLVDLPLYARERDLYQAALTLLDGERQLEKIGGYKPRAKIAFDLDKQEIRITSVLSATVTTTPLGAEIKVQDRGIDINSPVQNP